MKTLYRFDSFVFNPGSGELSSPTGVVVLQPQPALLLEVLLSRAGEVVSRDELYEALWPNTKVEFDLGLNAAVRSLRKALGDDAAEPRYVETLRRRGYRWIAPLRDQERMDEAGTTGGLLSRLRGTAIAVVGIAAALLLTWLGGVSPADAPPARTLEPRLVQLRYLLDHGDDEDWARALRELEALPAAFRESGSGRALAAELHYAVGNEEEAAQAARAALAVNGDLAGARRVLGLFHLYQELDPEAALAVMRVAVEAGTESSDLMHAYGVALAAQGRFREAMSTMRRAVELDPVSPNLTFDGWLVAYLARDYGTSRAWCDDLGRLTGQDTSRCHLLATLGSGQREEAARIARRFLHEREGVGFAGDLTPESILHSYWEWDLERPRHHLPAAQRAFGEARALAQLGRLDEALERLTEAASGRAPEMVFAQHLPYFDPLAGDPRFAETIRRATLQGADQG